MADAQRGHPNEGARLLWLALERTEQTPYRLGLEMFGKPGHPVYRWLHCQQKPDAVRRAELQERFPEIDWRSWDQDPTEPFEIPDDPPEARP